MPLSVDICIACYKRDPFLGEALRSCYDQDYPNNVLIYYDDVGVGTGEAFNRAIKMGKGDVTLLLCSDDVLTDTHVVSDIVKLFEKYPDLVHVTRYYHQFVENDRRPVRAWRSDDIMELANNPSGLAFRRSAIGDAKLSNKMFVEASSFVSEVRNNSNNGWTIIIPWDMVAVRVHKSTARSPEYFRKMWTTSPVEEWRNYGGTKLLRDYTSLIQVKNYFTTRAVAKEIWNFIKYAPDNLLHPSFWFFSLVAIITPRKILYKIPELYRATWGRWTTREVKRCET